MNRYRKKFKPIDKEFSYFLTKKLSLSSQKYGLGIQDPRSGKNPYWITDLEVKKAPDLGSRSATLHVQMVAMVEYWGGWIFRISGHDSDH
jgi:hypothetical protein